MRIAFTIFGVIYMVVGVIEAIVASAKGDTEGAQWGMIHILFGNVLILQWGDEK